MPTALRHRDFRLFWMAAVLSAVGSQFVAVGNAWQIYELTNSPLQIGLLALARGLPQLILVLVGGVLADAVDRRRLLLVTQITQFAVVFSLVGFTATGQISPAILYISSILQAFASAFDMPARQALVPNLVPRQDLTSAIALTSIQRTLGSIAGPSIAGVVLAAAGAEWCYAVGSFSSLVMWGVLLIIRSTQTARGGRRAFNLAALGEGWTFVWTHPILLALMVLDFNATFFGNQRALFPVYARDVLFVGPQGLGMLSSAVSVGSLLGAALVHRLPRRDWAGWWVMIGMTFFGLSTCIFALSTNFWLSVIMLAGTGLGNSTASILRNTINQLVTPDELRGRVLSVNSVFTTGGPQLGQFESGAVAEAWGPEVSAFTGGLAAVLIVPMLVLVPAIRHFHLGRASVEAAHAQSA